MSNMSLPVVVDVLKPDGSTERVTIGSARRDGPVFVLELAALKLAQSLAPPRIASVAPPPPPPEATETPPPAPPPAPASRSTLEELEGIAARARKTLADLTKVRWHRQEAELLSRVEEEMARLR